MEQLEGYVEHIIFRNAENGYTVMNVVCGQEEITCVGSMQYIDEGEMIEARGHYIEHPVYGQQFQMESYEIKVPTDILSIERYLGSGAIKGVGAALAGRIVRRFKGDTFRIIEEEPERLAEVKGISERKAREIAEQIDEKRDLRKATIFLQQYGISTALSVKIYEQYGQKIYQIIKENPYKMADDIQGIGFKIADEIAEKVGIHTDSDFRIRSGILYILLQACSEGHTYLPKNVLLRRAESLLQVKGEYIEKHFMDLAIEKKLMLKERTDKSETRQDDLMQEDRNVEIYASQYYFLELNTAKMLHDLNVTYEIGEAEIRNRLKQIEENTEISLDEMQREAVVEAAKSGILVVTGGPGTGKTTTINAIIKYFESEGMDIFLAAPTGRAAKRMTEATGYEAQTIHRLLELSGIPDENLKVGFERNEQNPLEADAIIIDEMSMVDTHLMCSLLKAIMVGTRLIMVGDVNQLPSVGPGSILKDIIESKEFPVVKLTKIFRQASQSAIVVNAHKINKGEAIPLHEKKKDFFIMRRYDAESTIEMMRKLILDILPPNIAVRPYDIQVLTPMRKGILGVEELNKKLQEIMNPADKNKAEKEYGDHCFREGDKVMQIKNNYQLEWEIRNKYGIAVDKGLGVFNGDMGLILEINQFAELMTVEFDEGRKVEYSFKQLDELELAYAITIHKSQGSEYPAVIMPLLTGPKLLMNRNLLYTGVTRARQCVTIVGNEETVQAMIENESEQKRYSGLRERIVELGEAL